MRVVCTITFLIFLSIAPIASSAAGTILVMGDSLSAAYGIDKQSGWVALLQQRLQQQKLGYQVVNASISGDTTRGGLSRLTAALKRESPAVLVLALGANDGLRGFAPERIRENLRLMIRQARDADTSVLLLGIKLPANYGSLYGDKFHRVYLDLANQEAVHLVPFFLEGVAETRELMQADGIHPGVQAQPRILDNVWAGLSPLLIQE